MKKSTLGLVCTAPLLALLVAVATGSAFTAAPATATANKTSATPAPARRPVLLTGEVQALDAQPILVPPSNSSPVTLRNFVAEGTSVKTGDVVLRIETGGAANIERLKSELEQARARAALEAANLEVSAVDADKALVTAQAALAKAKVDAVLPKAQVSALTYDRNQAELDRATRDLTIKQDARTNARQAVMRRREDGELEVKRLQINLAFQIAQLAQSEVRAGHDGVVIHGYGAFSGGRLEEGASAMPGNAAGVVQDDGEMEVVAWALEADRSYLSDGQAVRLRFDALPGKVVNGHISSITSAPEARARWGSGRYFKVKIALPPSHDLVLVAGMSVLVEPQTGAALPPTPPSKASTEALTLEGEIASRQQLPISPPAIPEVWQYKLAMLVPEGTLVQPGQTIALFEANEVGTQLDAQQNTLREKQRALEKMQLDQAEADRAGALAVAEAQSNAEKAERKATQPKELIRRVDYDKLVIERGEKQALAALAAAQYQAQRQARVAERAGLQAEITQAQNLITILSNGRSALDVKARQRGLVLYRNNFSGEKFTTGSQVWMGLSVATLADPDQLFVDARVPEAQAARLKVGQPMRVMVPGANQTLTAHVSGLGRTFHSKQRSQAIIVRDIELEFDTPSKGLKPGTAVQAELSAATPSVKQAQR